jgi:hypothetical protein
MSDFITRYEAQLHDAARRELRKGPRPWARRFAAICLVGLVAAGVPAAAHNGWFPFAGRADAPTTTSASPAAGLRDMLSVLRRPQTEGDRRAARYALKFFARPHFEGVQTDYIRRAGGVILVPTRSRWLMPGAPVQHDVICVWRTDHLNGARMGGGLGCYEAARIAGGTAIESLGRRVDWLVPDSVARVEVGGSVGTVTPRDNVASWTGPWPKQIAWYSADGTRFGPRVFP